MMDTFAKLRRKAWPKEEIEKTLRILARAPAKKTRWIQLFDMILYWVAVLLAVVGNFALSVSLVPVMWVLSGVSLFFIIVVLGVTFGFVFEFLLCNVGRKVSQQQYIVAGLFIPAVALINIYLTTSLSNHLATLMNLPPTSIHFPALVSLVYVAAFMVPYAIHKINMHRPLPA